MAIQVAGQVGPQTIADGVAGIQRLEKTGGVVVQELHGRLYEQNYRGGIFSGGMTLTSISNVTFTTGTLGATCTPIIGVWNPPASPVNLVILQAVLGITITAATATGGGPFVWATSTGQLAITTGSIPFSRKTLAQIGSVAKHFANVALTGLVGSLVVQGAAGLAGGSLQGYSFVGTAAGAQTPLIANMDIIDGAIIVPPGGVLALLATTTPVAHSAASSIVWEEVPV